MSADVDVSRELAEPVSRASARNEPSGFDDFYRRELPGLLTLARPRAALNQQSLVE